MKQKHLSHNFSVNSTGKLIFSFYHYDTKAYLSYCDPIPLNNVNFVQNMVYKVCLGRVFF